MKGKILVVEDESSILTIIRTYLTNAGFTVISSDNGLDALALAKQSPPDLIVLDLNLPGMDGLDVAVRLREWSDVYILMLTARGEEVDRITGLQLGADDYLTKPFSPRELVARVEALLRRRRATSFRSHLTRFQNIAIDPDGHVAYAGDKALDMTATEFQVLWALVQHAGRVLTRDQLMTQVWGANYYGTERVVDVYVGQVRRKLQEATGKVLIETVRGVGYKFVDDQDR
ncbi:MAG: response regulator transcription factor [Anaerolineales bacterium]|nr:response regulator transcription factor [Anaerolineales bacterium]